MRVGVGELDQQPIPEALPFTDFLFLGIEVHFAWKQNVTSDDRWWSDTSLLISDLRIATDYRGNGLSPLFPRTQAQVLLLLHAWTDADGL